MSTSSPLARLDAQIDALSKSLKAAKQLDDATRKALASLQREIDDSLHRQGDDSLRGRLEQMAVRFENEHPAVGSALRQAIDALSKAGM